MNKKEGANRKRLTETYKHCCGMGTHFQMTYFGLINNKSLELISKFIIDN